MNNLREIRRRIRSIENIKKITDAMERVAASRLQRAQLHAEQSRAYFVEIKKIMDDLLHADIQCGLTKEREVKKIAVVILSADRGLSGAYSANLFNKTDKFLQKYDPSKVDLVVVGKKGIEYYHRKVWRIRHRIESWGGKITFTEIKEFADQLYKWFEVGEYDEVYVSFTEYINIMKQEVRIEQFLSFQKPSSNHPQDFIFEPAPAEIFEAVLPRYCVSRFQNAFNEAYASELAARVISMRAASKNSQEILDRLTLVRNKVRQAGITREMIEITSGGIK